MLSEAIHLGLQRSHAANGGVLRRVRAGTSGVRQRIGSTARVHVGDGAGGERELVQVAHEEPLEGVGLLVADPALVVLVVVVPRVLEAPIEEGRDLGGLELVRGLQDHASGELGFVLHEELLAGLVARGSDALLGELREDVVHDLVLVGAIVAREVLVLVGPSVNVSTLRIGVVLKSHGSGKDRHSDELHF